MTSPDALDVLDAFGSAGFGHLVDGGWGVDALVGEQTRRHEDLDLVVARSDLPRAEAALRPLGFAHAAGEEPGLPARLVLRAPGGRQVDPAPGRLRRGGERAPGPGRRDLGRLPAAGLAGRGRIAGHGRPLLAPELQLRFHLGYEPGPSDRHDVALLRVM